MSEEEQEGQQQPTPEEMGNILVRTMIAVQVLPGYEKDLDVVCAAQHLQNLLRGQAVHFWGMFMLGYRGAVGARYKITGCELCGGQGYVVEQEAGTDVSARAVPCSCLTGVEPTLEEGDSDHE